MGVRRDGWLDQSGLNTIRIVIGAYFCVAALGVQVGFDPYILTGLVWPGEMGQSVASAALMACAITFVLGFVLRPMSLILSGFLILSAIVEMTHLGGGGHNGAIWQSLAFGAAILLCYGPIKPHEIHKAAIFSSVSFRGGAARVLQKNVTPRRVHRQAPGSKLKRRDPGLRTLGPWIAPTDLMIGLAKDTPPRDRSRPKPVTLVEDDLENIFANL